ncbi:hypothetical protein BC835DRAFT_678480 [Cytidiella melzeri]|nr:hypothetical protein BC835DRAFT_678480 [Cytidiella melzeri]
MIYHGGCQSLAVLGIFGPFNCSASCLPSSGGEEQALCLTNSSHQHPRIERENVSFTERSRHACCTKSLIFRRILARLSKRGQEYAQETLGILSSCNHQDIGMGFSGTRGRVGSEVTGNGGYTVESGERERKLEYGVSGTIKHSRRGEYDWI